MHIIFCERIRIKHTSEKLDSEKSGFQMFWDFENPEFESPLYVLCHVSVNDPETNGVSEQHEDNEEELVNLNKISCFVDTSIITFSDK